LFVLHTGIAWRHLPLELGFGSGWTCYRRLDEWQKAGCGSACTRCCCRSYARDVLIVSWASGGNLPPLLAAGRLRTARDHSVWVLASAATREQAVKATFEVVSYRRARDPNMELAFEQQAARLMAIAAGSEAPSTCARSRQKCGPS
jgi:transposase